MSTWSDDLVPGGRTPQGPPPQGPPPQGPPPGPPTLPPVSLPASTSAGFSGAVAAIVVVVLVVALAVPAAALAAGAKGFWPAQWDPRLAPITERDTALRGLTLRARGAGRVPLRQGLREVDRRLRQAESRPIGPRRIAKPERSGRSTSSTARPTCRRRRRAADDAGILAFYDDQAKEVVIRGTTLDVSHRATLAHELTHVLQDQHFDLPAHRGDARRRPTRRVVTPPRR